MIDATFTQPAPRDGYGPAIHDLVVEDLDARKARGLATYGRFLRAGNGRNALWDLYEELLDAACYIRQAIAEADEAAWRIDGEWARADAEAARAAECGDEPPW